VAEHLVRRGRPAYLVDYGPVRFGDRSLGLEHWIEDVVPRAVRAVAHDAGDRPVQLVGWCLGGILALLAHVADAGLPVASVALVASPFDVARVPLVAPLRPIAAITQGRVVTELYRLLGGAPAPLVKRGYQLAGIDKYLMKPWTVLSNLHDRELLAQIEAVDAFMDGMHAYPGRTFGQLYHRFLRANDLAGGRLVLSDRTLELDAVRVPLLAVAGEGDGIAPVAACHRLGELVPNAPAVQLATAPGGHLGVLTGRAARGTTWVLLDRFLAAHDVQGPRQRRRAAV
jgi:polyhydroxyalkanoate synthase